MDVNAPLCPHSLAVEGRSYPCRLHAGHRHQHRAQVTADRRVSAGVIEKGAELVWPNAADHPDRAGHNG